MGERSKKTQSSSATSSGGSLKRKGGGGGVGDGDETTRGRGGDGDENDSGDESPDDDSNHEEVISRLKKQLAESEARVADAKTATVSHYIAVGGQSSAWMKDAKIKEILGVVDNHLPITPQPSLRTDTMNTYNDGINESKMYFVKEGLLDPSQTWSSESHANKIKMVHHTLVCR